MASEASKVDNSCLEKLITMWMFPKRPSKSMFCIWAMGREMSLMGEYVLVRPSSPPPPPATHQSSASQQALGVTFSHHSDFCTHPLASQFTGIHILSVSYHGVPSFPLISLLPLFTCFSPCPPTHSVPMPSTHLFFLLTKNLTYKPNEEEHFLSRETNL